MKVRYFAWFESKKERQEFIELLNSCTSDIDALNRVADKYPELSMTQVYAIVENFKQEINKK